MVAYLGLTEGAYASLNNRLSIEESVNNLRTSYFKQTPTGVEWEGSPYGWAVNFIDGTGTGSNAERIDLGANTLGSGGAHPYIPQLRPGLVSIAIIMNPTAFTNSYGNVFSAGVLANADPFQYYGLFFNATNAQVYFQTATGGAGSYGPGVLSNVTAGTWCILIGTWDGVTQKIYKDGVLQASASFSGTCNTSLERRVTLAGIPETTGTQTGKFKCAGAAVWNRALSQDEVAQWSFDPFEVIRPRFRLWRISSNVLSPSLSDSISVAENVAKSLHTVSTITKSISDSISIGELISYSTIETKLFANLADAITLSEFIHAQEAYQVLIYDAVGVSENFRSLYPILSSRLFESISISESTARALAIRRLQINAIESVSISELVIPGLPIIAAHPSDNVLVSEFVKTSLSLYAKLSESIHVAEDILPVLPQIFIRILADNDITVSDAVTAQLITFQSKLHLLSYLRRYLNDVVNTPPQGYIAIDPTAPEFIDNGQGFSWEVQKTDLTDYLRRYLNDVVQ